MNNIREKRSHNFLGLFESLIPRHISRDIRIYDPQQIVFRRIHLSISLQSNGYSHSQINKTFHFIVHPKPKPPTANDPPFSLTSLHYIHRIIDLINRSLAKNKIKTFFKPLKTLKQCFRSIKDKSNPLLSQAVYQNPCSWDKSYIGQMSKVELIK